MSAFQTKCSSINSCASFDFDRMHNECWIHSTNVEDRLRITMGIDHYQRVPCQSFTTSTTEDTKTTHGKYYRCMLLNEAGFVTFTAFEILANCWRRLSLDYWWLVRVTLVVAFGFLPQNFGRWLVTYELSFYLKRNAASVVLTMLGSGDTQTLLDGKKNYSLCRWWGCKNVPKH